MVVLWASGLLAGLEASRRLSHRVGWNVAGIQYGLALMLLAVGALLPVPWSSWAWVAASVLTLGLSAAQRPGMVAFLPLLIVLLLLLSGWIRAMPATAVPPALALWLAVPLAWPGRQHRQPLWLAGLAVLAFLALLTGTLLLLTGQLQAWLVQLLTACTLMALLAWSRSQAAGSGPEPGQVALQQAVRQERERIYQNLHDDIGARLLSLIHRASTPEEADFARCLLQDLRDAVARTVQLRLSLRDLLADQRAETEQRLQGLKLALIWPSPDSVPDQPLPPQAVAALKRSLRELLSNIIRHADASRVVLECTCDGRRLDLYLQDDGRGLPEPYGEGRGMSGIRRRMQSLGGTVAWLPAAGGGTRVHLQLPLAGSG